ncbi:hypothetical protein BH09SUM1_BH09SUM1_10340 [soil metagenome]
MVHDAEKYAHDQMEKYACGDPVNRVQIREYLVNVLSNQLGDYKYVKTRHTFQSAFTGGLTTITLHCAHNTPALYFGIRHDSVEEIRKRLFGADYLQSRQWARTIFMYSMNIGPFSCGWPCAVSGWWPVGGSEGLRLAGEEMLDFVRAIIFPYLQQHKDVLEIRNTLLFNKGHAQPVSIEQSVLGIDYAVGRRDWLDQDYDQLRTRWARYPADQLTLLDRAYQSAITHWRV